MTTASGESPSIQAGYIKFTLTGLINTNSTRRSLIALPAAFSLSQIFGDGTARAQAVGNPLKLFPAMYLDRQMYNPEIVEGKVTLIYVWASWCPFCLQDLPTLREKQETLRSRVFSILGLNADKNIDEALSWIKTYKVNFPNIRFTSDYKNTYMPQRQTTPPSPPAVVSAGWPRKNPPQGRPYTARKHHQALSSADECLGLRLNQNEVSVQTHLLAS